MIRSAISAACLAVFAAVLCSSASVAHGGITPSGSVRPVDPASWTGLTTAYIGQSGVGSVSVDNNSHLYSSRTYMGYSSGSTGTVTVGGPGSSWVNSGYFYIGYNGDGAMEVTNGGTVISGGVNSLGEFRYSTGEVTVSGGGSIWDNYRSLSVGEEGDGVLNISDGGLVKVSWDTFVAKGPTASGAINFDNGTLTTGGLVGAPSDLSGTGVINTGGLVSDVDLVFDAASGLTQTFGLNGPGQDITVNVSPDGFGSMGAGYGGSGSLRISDGLTVRSIEGYLGYASGSAGTATVSGAGTTWANTGDLYVGRYGDGTLEIANGAAVGAKETYISRYEGSTGVVTVTGDGSSLTNSKFLHVCTGRFSDATLNITDGGSVSTDYASIAGPIGSTGIVTVSGENSTFAASTRLHVGGDNLTHGTLEITNGGAASNNYCDIGRDTNSTGVVTVSGDGSTWTNSTWFYVGRSGNATLEITDGGAVSNTYCYIGYNSSATGEVTVSGEGSTWTNSGEIDVGRDGVGALSITDGGTVRNTFGTVATGTSGMFHRVIGVVTVSGEGSTWINSGHLIVARGGEGSMDITNGGTVSSDRGYIASGSIDSIGAVTVSGPGSTWTNSDHLFIAGKGNGSLDISDGGTVSNDRGYIGDQSIATGAVTVRGAGSTWTSSEFLTVGHYGHGTLDISDGAVVTNTDGNIGNLSSATGVVTVSGADSIWASSGDLYVGRSGDGALAIAEGGLVCVGGSLTIDLDGDGDSSITIATGGMLALDGNAAGSLADFLEMIDGTDDIRYFNESVWDWDQITSATRDVDFTLDYLPTGDLAGCTVLTVNTIPEPATMTLMALGALAVLKRRRVTTNPERQRRKT